MVLPPLNVDADAPVWSKTESTLKVSAEEPVLLMYILVVLTWVLSCVMVPVVKVHVYRVQTVVTVVADNVQLVSVVVTPELVVVWTS